MNFAPQNQDPPLGPEPMKREAFGLNSKFIWFLFRFQHTADQKQGGDGWG